MPCCPAASPAACREQTIALACSGDAPTVPAARSHTRGAALAWLARRCPRHRRVDVVCGSAVGVQDAFRGRWVARGAHAAGSGSGWRKGIAAMCRR